MRSGWDRTGAALLAVCVAGGVLTGCGSTKQGEAKPAEIDVRTLDVGSYGTHPLPVPENNRESYGRIIEAVHTADAVASPYKIDPALRWWSGAEPRPDAKSATGTLADVTLPVLEKEGFIVGYAVGGRSEKFPDEGKPKVGDARAITINLLRFPDEASAKRAAEGIDAADFGISPENVRVDIPKYSDAHSHWRPNVPTLGSTISHGIWVISVYAEHTSPDKSALIDLVTKTFDAQIPLLDSFKPTPADKVSSLPLDATGLLRRTLPYKPELWPYPTVEFEDPGSAIIESGNVSREVGIVYTGIGGLHSSTDKEAATKLFDAVGLEYWAAVDVGTFLYKVRDEAAGKQLVDNNFGDEPDSKGDIDGPTGVPGAKCFEYQNTAVFRCSVVYRNYVGTVISDDEADVRHKAAAQYALLANSF